ncbi:MAG: GDSL-type esterase/lipase family protein [bacterium]
MRTTALCKHAIPAILLLGGLISTSVFAFEQPKVYDLKPNERILILGDSTTYDGTSHGGYVRLAEQGIQEQSPDLKVVIRAWGGYGLPLVPENPAKRPPFAEQWKALLGHPNAPTTVMINLGINDSGRGEAHLQAYEKWVRQYVEELRAAKMNVILCTPTLWCGLERTKPNADAVRRVATEMKCPLVDLQAAHVEACENKKGIHRDMGHLNMTGEILSASTILKAFGLKAEWKKYQLRITIGREGCATGIEGGAFGGPFTGNPKSVLADPPAQPTPASELENPKNLWLANWSAQQPAYAPGTKVTLRLDPASGRVFHSWTDFQGQIPNNAPETLTITMDEHKWVHLYYKNPPPK